MQRGGGVVEEWDEDLVKRRGFEKAAVVLFLPFPLFFFEKQTIRASSSEGHSCYLWKCLGERERGP